MAIVLTPVHEGELWAGATWAVEDEDLLAALIARVAIGQARVAERILLEDDLLPVNYPKGGHESARSRLRVNPGGDPYHRDGWIFQIISWIAAHRAGRPGVIRAPQILHADKGLDGLLVEFDEDDIARVVISEEKATKNARKTVSGKVWPEFRNFETGKRDAELTDGVSAMLAGHPDADAMVAAILWEEKRAYRVVVTIDDEHGSAEGRKALYEGYEAAVSGKAERRRAEAFYVADLRPWFDDLAVKVIAVIDAEEAAINV